jgi:hypothetical protein
MTKKITVAALVCMLCISAAVAEERSGVAVYPGAKHDLVRTELLVMDPSIEGAAYRTNDDIGKVTAFYQKQGLLLLKVGSPSKEYARFSKAESGVNVVVQQPWRDPKSKAMMQDTLILIMREKEK